MGKKGGKSGSSSKAKAAPKCTCDHPFQCSCGNRPERPSRGHKWDPEEQKWGGKGHKQKGGSGQTSSVATVAKVTDVGKTEIAQWQRLPSQLLADVCKKERRPFPKYKALDQPGGKHKYRVIVQDAKATKRGGEHDLIFVPAQAVMNEEQAKEESALLALLSMTPSIPHERKLPDPYKATWISTVQAQKEQKNQGGKKPAADKKVDAKKSPTPSGKSPNNGNGAAAVASTNLVHANSYTSGAEKRKQKEMKRKTTTERIRKHEALRNANRDVQVFMSAQIRKQIETLLREDSCAAELLKLLHEEESNDLDMSEEKDEANDEGDMIQTYVVQRLEHEGFLKSQAKAGYTATMKNLSPELELSRADDDVFMDKIYDESLQWLCVHLNEDQLPEGFDPRGRTLDVVVAPAATKKSDDKQNKDDSEPKIVLDLVESYGMTSEESKLLLKYKSGKAGEDSNSETMKSSFWDVTCESTGNSHLVQNESQPLSSTDKESNIEMSQDEIEVLGSMFPSEDDCNITTSSSDGGEMTKISIILQSIDGVEGSSHAQVLEICYRKGLYPSEYPRALIVGGWNVPSIQAGLGTASHAKIADFLSTLPKGEPMLFELFGFVQDLMQNEKELSQNYSSKLLPFLGGGETKSNGNIKGGKNNGIAQKNKKKNKDSGARQINNRPAHHRPRERSFFWSKLPKETPPAQSFPKLTSSMQKARSNLPAAKARDEFLNKMKQADDSGRVILVTGETGCGKTTQIPQFILEEAPIDAKIVVAQPRRLAATGVAGRVANERGEDKPGDGSVGFVVRGEVAMCNKTRLMFCTTGVLLRQLQSEGALDCVTHIVVDEVHERHLDTDILLGILKQCLATTPNLRVVLMSATMDADRFAAYWGSNTPRMHIPGFTHPVQDYTLEDVLSLTGYIPPKNGKKKKFRSNMYPRKGAKQTAWNDSENSGGEEEVEEKVVDETTVVKIASKPVNTVPIEDLVKRVDESNIDYDLIAQLVQYLVQNKEYNDDGSILIFLPGAPEIARAKESILRLRNCANISLLPLHGGLQPRDQQKIFGSVQRGHTKVILSTNVAETSITIPDCTIVVDTCKEKQSSYDPSNRMPLLLERFASQDSLRQRRGRAGRVRPGTCYKLISRKTFDKLPLHGEPEIKRCALDSTILSLLYLGLEQRSGDFLSSLLDAPSKDSINAAIYSLEKLGALISSKDKEGTSLALSPLGTHLAGIPAPPSVGKMLVMGTLLGCRSAAIAIAAGMSVGRSPFLKIDTYRNNRNAEESEKESIERYRNELILNERQTVFQSVGNSDHAMLAAVFMNWESINGGQGGKKKYCEQLGLSIPGMREMKQLAQQLDGSLSSAGYVATVDTDANSNSWKIIRTCIVSALAPSQLVRVQRPTTKYAETAEGALEKDGVAKELKFFTRGVNDDDGANKDESEMNAGRKMSYNGNNEERVFIHPSSANFSVGSYSCPWLVYHEMVRTSKPFLRDATECSSYALLLFGGKVEVRASEGLISIDAYTRLSANARIGALVGGLRRKVDDLLSQKIKKPSLDIAASIEMKLIVKLLKTEGLGL